MWLGLMRGDGIGNRLVRGNRNRRVDSQLHNTCVADLHDHADNQVPARPLVQLRLVRVREVADREQLSIADQPDLPHRPAARRGLHDRLDHQPVRVVGINRHAADRYTVYLMRQRRHGLCRDHGRTVTVAQRDMGKRHNAARRLRIDQRSRADRSQQRIKFAHVFLGNTVVIPQS